MAPTTLCAFFAVQKSDYVLGILRGTIAWISFNNSYGKFRLQLFFQQGTVEAGFNSLENFGYRC
jgi:hypothetical protein